MNYRHAFHAGNFADVLKHVVLSRILVHLCAKPAAFRVIDIHAGAGRYALSGPEASRTGEWRDGIGRLDAAVLAEPAETLLAPYRAVIRRCNPSGILELYPGSPLIVQRMLRQQDRLTACELVPAAAADLAAALGRDRRCKAIAIDGWTALNAYVPPRERRGLVLIDPPFEDAREFARLPERVAAAWRKWPGGIYLIWYPVKQRAAPDAMARDLQQRGLAKLLRVELAVARPDTTEGLTAAGLMVINPPWTLPDDLSVLLPALAAVLDQGGADTRLDWLSREK